MVLNIFDPKIFFDQKSFCKTEILSKKIWLENKGHKKLDQK